MLNIPKIALLIVAAGQSARLGQPKQLLPFKNTFLLGYMMQECARSAAGDVFVVLGANKELIEPHLNTNYIKDIFYNPNWSDGMGSSIACGVANLQNQNYDGVIVLLGDQPFFKADLLHQLIRQQKNTKARIIVSKYQKGMGPPTYFDASLFLELAELNDDVGAKPIIQRYWNEMKTIDFEKGHIDIDSTEDLKWLESF
jgi:molybdenum cofactor cytidylyltransferase